MKVQLKEFTSDVFHAMKMTQTVEEVVSSDQTKAVKTGTLGQVNQWAKKKQLRFKPDSSMFGGYWVDDTTSHTFHAIPLN